MAKRLRYAITGPPNVGKSSLFIALTGIHVKTANYPGTTLEIRSGTVKGTDVEVTDLPGILRPENPLDEDEKTAVREIVEGGYDGVVVVAAPHAWHEAVDIAKFASKFKPVVLVFNMVDLWKPPNSESELSKLVSAPVVYVSAIKHYGVKKLASLLVRGINSSTPTEYVLEIPKAVGLVSNVLTRPAPALALILSMAFVSVALLVALVEGIAPWGELPFSINGALDMLEKRVSDVVYAAIPDVLTASFIADGLWGSVVTLASISMYVLVALVLVVLYEESGLVAHLSHGVEKLLTKIGVPPRGAVCLFMGISCNVPAIAGAQVLWGQGNRTLTALLIPYMPCAARLAIFASVATAALVNAPYLIPLMVLLPYLVSLAAAVTASAIYRKILKINPTSVSYTPLAPIMPPKPKIYVAKLFLEFKSFFQKAGPALLLFLILLWPFKSFGFQGFVTDVSQSFLAEVGKMLEPVFTPIGLPWEVSSSLLAGWVFKETVLGILVATGGLDILPSLSIASVTSFLVFVSFYSACVATLVQLYRTVGAKATFTSITLNLFTAYAASTAVYLLLSPVA